LCWPTLFSCFLFDIPSCARPSKLLHDVCDSFSFSFFF
jgi:hypothetical protein